MIKTNKTNSSDDLKGISLLSKFKHELKSPMNGIIGILSHWEENWDKKGQEFKKDDIVEILDACKELMVLVETLQDKTDNENQITFNFTMIDVVTETKTAVEKSKNLNIGNKKIQIKFVSLVNQCKILADKFWYGQLLANLLLNSINYTKSGIITVSIRIEKIKNIDNCIVSVKDEGIGIPEDELDSIFEPYNRSSRSQTQTKGTGLGLAICKEIVTAHQGSISASNNSDTGATVEFLIPVQL